jgi:hypothetical protein
MNKSVILSEKMKISSENQGKTRKTYHPPQLTLLGDLRTLTLGSSVWNPMGDSPYCDKYQYYSPYPPNKCPIILHPHG